MDLGSAIIGAIIIAICILPFIIMNRSKKKREKQFLQSLSKIATQHDCQVNQYEIFGSFAIGLDKIKNFVFFYKQIKDKVEEHTICLGEIQSCKILNISRSLKTKSGSQNVIDRLELSFIPIAENKPEIKLEFFNTDISVQLNGELQSIEKWSKLINDRLGKKALIP